MRRLALSVLTVLTVTLAYGCDSSNPVAPGQHDVVSGSITATFYQTRAIHVTKTGTMTVTLTWPSASVNLDLYLSPDTCTGYPLTRCTLLAQSRATTGSRESFTYGVTAGQVFIVCIDSFAQIDSSYTLDVSIP